MSIIAFLLLVLATIFVLYLINVCFKDAQLQNILRIIVFIVVVLILLVMFGVIPQSVIGTHFTLH